MSPKSDLASLPEGVAFQARRPWAVLGLATLGMALNALPPLLQILSRLPDGILVDLALGFAGLLPLQMYLIPRFIAEADAAAGGNDRNPRAEWEANFDRRWLPSMAASILVSLAAGLGLLFLILPGLFIFMGFGWTSLRVLVRGEALADAARGSVRMMAAAWRRVLGVGLVVASILLVCSMIISLSLRSLGEDPGPWLRLRHPGLWAVNFFTTLLNLWASTTFLALFRRINPAIKS